MLNTKLDFGISKECSAGVSAPGFEGLIAKVSIFLIPIFLIFGYWALSEPALITPINGYEIKPSAFLPKANLKNSMLADLNLSEANLTGADLSGAVMTDALLPDGKIHG